MGILQSKMFRKKSYKDTEGHLERRLGALSLVMLGIGGTIGAGIFVITGKAAATMAGPAIIFSFIFAAVAVGISALVYAELSSKIPVSGGAYSYTYTAMGEFIGWLVGWNLILEYGLIVPAVSTGWSGYFRGLIEEIFNYKFSPVISGAFDPANGTYIDLFAFLMTIVIFGVLTLGIKKSSSANIVVVSIKILVLLLFIFVGAKYIDFNNLKNFMPFGWSGVLAATSLMVFAYLGFDAVATVAEETKDPQKNLPIGLIVSLAVSTLLYLVVSFMLTAIVPYDQLDVPDALSHTMYKLNEPVIGSLIALGAVITIISVLIVMGIGLTRVVYALARDGLIPKSLATLHPKTNAPYKITILSGVISSFFAGFVPLGVLAELINIGTLFAYFMIGVTVVVLRRQDDYKAMQGGFRVPYPKILLPLNLILLAVIMYGLSFDTWIRFFIWSLIGVAVYFMYGIKHSTLNEKSN